MKAIFDIAIIGGGIMGCGTALRVAEGVMRAVILDQGDIGQGASGVNAGTLSMQIKRVKLMPYAIKGHSEWKRMGDDVGFHCTGVYTLAFNDREADLLNQRMTLKKQAGANISFVSPKSVFEKEPHLAKKIIAASYCPDDGYANSSLTGHYYRTKINDKGISYSENFKVTEIRETDIGYDIFYGDRQIKARRILLASGGWLKNVAAMMGADLQIRARINTV